MPLQQLLQRNNQNVREVYLDQKSTKKIFNAQFFTRRKPFEFVSAQQGLKLSVGNFVQNQVSESDLISRNKSNSSKIHQLSFGILRDKKIICDAQNQKIQPSRFNINLNHRSRSRQSEKKSKLYSAQVKLYKKKFSVEKPIYKNIQLSYAGQTKITGAGSSHQSPKFKIFDKGVFELPESFTLKTSKIPFTPKSSVTLFNRPHSTLINYDQNLLSGRQESIHSRGRMRQQEQMTKSRKARSQQNFYIREKSNTEPINKIGFLQEFQQIQFKKEQGLRLEIEKINLHRKTIKRNDYVNLFYEYQKSKVKLQKQDMYTPWKKYQKDNKKSLDLAQLIQLHQY